MGAEELKLPTLVQHRTQLDGPALLRCRLTVGSGCPARPNRAAVHVLAFLHLDGKLDAPTPGQQATASLARSRPYCERPP